MGKNILLVKVTMLCIVTFLFCGCNQKREVVPPDMFPVSGKVLSTSGQIPVGYTVMLNPEDKDMEKAASGPVQEDGFFVLQTRYMGERFDGVIPGKYQVALGAPYEKGSHIHDVPQTVDVTGEITDLTIQFSFGN